MCYFNCKLNYKGKYYVLLQYFETGIIYCSHWMLLTINKLCQIYCSHSKQTKEHLSGLPVTFHARCTWCSISVQLTQSAVHAGQSELHANGTFRQRCLRKCVCCEGISSKSSLLPSSSGRHWPSLCSALLNI